MKALAGLGPLVRLILRRDRVTLPIWVLLIGVLPMAAAGGIRQLYTTEAGLAQAAAGFGANPAFLAMFGPIHGNTLGALVAWRSGLIPVVVGVISVMTVIRHTRVEEEAGRRELLGATVVGRHAPLTAALLVVVGANVGLGVLSAATLAAADLPTTGSIAFGLSIAAVGTLFAVVGAFTAQLSEGAGPARGIGLAALGAAYVLRAAGDAGGTGSALGWLSWTSPFGWGSRVRPYADERWWILALPLIAALLIGGIAYRISARRDVGGGIIAAGLGPGGASPWLRSPIGLAWRLQRGLLIGWSAGFAVLGLIYGGVAESVQDLIADNPDLVEIFERLGGGGVLSDIFIAAVMSLFGLIAAGYGIQSTLRLRAEEEALRAEAVLATAVSRPRWMVGHLLFALLGPAVALLVGGFATGLAYGTIADDVAGQLPRVVGAALVHLPAVWVMVAIVAALFGFVPRLSSWGWGVYGAVVVIAMLGPVLQLSHWILDLSPFTHIPPLPGADLRSQPLLWLLAVTAAFTIPAFVTFRRRDLT